MFTGLKQRAAGGGPASTRPIGDRLVRSRDGDRDDEGRSPQGRVVSAPPPQPVHVPFVMGCGLSHRRHCRKIRSRPLAIQSERARRRTRRRLPLPGECGTWRGATTVASRLRLSVASAAPMRPDLTWLPSRSACPAPHPPRVTDDPARPSRTAAGTERAAPLSCGRHPIPDDQLPSNVRHEHVLEPPDRNSDRALRRSGQAFRRAQQWPALTKPREPSRGHLRSGPPHTARSAEDARRRAEDTRCSSGPRRLQKIKTRRQATSRRRHSRHSRASRRARPEGRVEPDGVPKEQGDFPPSRRSAAAPIPRLLAPVDRK